MGKQPRPLQRGDELSVGSRALWIPVERPRILVRSSRDGDREGKRKRDVDVQVLPKRAKEQRAILGHQRQTASQDVQSDVPNVVVVNGYTS